MVAGAKRPEVADGTGTPPESVALQKAPFRRVPDPTAVPGVDPGIQLEPVHAIANRFFTAVGNYLYAERPKPSATDCLFRRVEGTAWRAAVVS